MRKGNYTVKYGGKKKLPIFITSNSPLVWDLRNYILEQGELDEGTANWNVSALPLVSDNMVMCRLWVPKAKSLTAIPTLTLARNAYAAQQAGTPFFEKLKTTTKELKEKHNIDIVDLSEVRKSRFEEILVKNTSGDTEELTTDIVATSVEELVAVETMELQQNVASLKDEKKQYVLTIDRQKQQIIQSASNRFINKIGTRSCLIYAAQNWWIINTLLFGSLSLCLAQAKGNPIISNAQYFGYFYIFIFLRLKILEKPLNKATVTEFWLRKAVPKVWRKYAEFIKKSLTGLEKEFEAEILANCLSETKLFSKYQMYCRL